MTDRRAAPRLVFLVEDFWPVVHGATTQIMLLSERLVKLGASAQVLTRRISEEHASRESIDGYEIVRVPPAIGLSRLGKYLMIIPAMWAVFRERRNFDVLIVCDFKVLGVWAIALARLLRKPIFLRAESCGEMDGSFIGKFDDPPSKFATGLILGLIRLRNRILDLSDGFLSISSAIRDELLRAGVPAEKIIDLTNGVDLGRFTPVSAGEKQQLQQRLGFSHGRNVVFSGRLAKGKGLESLLRAWRDVVKTVPDAHLTLVGSGQGFSLACEDELKAYVEENQLGATVSFTGSVRNVEDYLRSADVFVFPSESEGLGLSLVEAMACGIACVATAVGGILDIVDDEINGLLVPVGDDQRLAGAIQRLLEDEQLANTFRVAGRQKIESHFDIDKIAVQYLQLVD